MKKVFIIAEAGINHNGSLLIAKKLIKAAKDSGADAIKFQSFNTEKVITITASKADYQKRTTCENETQFEMAKKLELTYEEQTELFTFAKRLKITFLSSPFDIDSIKFLKRIGLETIKIPSGEITNYPYLKYLGERKGKIILSTGMSKLGEIEEAIQTIVSGGTLLENITVLHCNSEYPTPFSDVNLAAMLTIRDSFKVKIGFSDHTLGIEIPIAAVALGAEVIEKHFTLDKKMEGPDHQASLEPNEFKNMVDAIRNIEKAIGNGIKKPSKSELKNIPIVRKSLVANMKIKKGDYFTIKNIGVKRPGIGISPMLWDSILGKKASKDFKKDDFIEI